MFFSMLFVLVTIIITLVPAPQPLSIELALPLMPIAQNLISNSVDLKIKNYVSLSNFEDAMKHTASSMSVPAVVSLPMEPGNALIERRNKPLHPFHIQNWLQLIQTEPLLLHYSVILQSFFHGFQVGIPSIFKTFIPQNSHSITLYSKEFNDLINKELSIGHYIGPFTQSQLESLIGPFQCSPLAIIPKPHSTKFRLI